MVNRGVLPCTIAVGHQTNFHWGMCLKITETVQDERRLCPDHRNIPRFYDARRSPGDLPTTPFEHYMLKEQFFKALQKQVFRGGLNTVGTTRNISPSFTARLTFTYQNGVSLMGCLKHIPQRSLRLGTANTLLEARTLFLPLSRYLQATRLSQQWRVFASGWRGDVSEQKSSADLV